MKRPHYSQVQNIFVSRMSIINVKQVYLSEMKGIYRLDLEFDLKKDQIKWYKNSFPLKPNISKDILVLIYKMCYYKCKLVLRSKILLDGNQPKHIKH